MEHIYVIWHASGIRLVWQSLEAADFIWVANMTLINRYQYFKLDSNTLKLRFNLLNEAFFQILGLLLFCPKMAVDSGSFFTARRWSRVALSRTVFFFGEWNIYVNSPWKNLSDFLVFICFCWILCHRCWRFFSILIIEWVKQRIPGNFLGWKKHWLLKVDN